MPELGLARDIVRQKTLWRSENLVSGERFRIVVHFALPEGDFKSSVDYSASPYETMCSCVRDENAYCEHIIAAVLLSEQYLPALRLRETSSIVSIPMDEEFNLKNLQIFPDAHSAQFMAYYVKDVKVEPYLVKLQIPDDTRRFALTEVHVQFADKAVNVTSYPSAKSKGPSKVELAALIYLNSAGRKFLQEADPEFDLKMLLKTAAEFGINNEKDARKYFQRQKDGAWLLKSNYSGLVRFGSSQTRQWIDPGALSESLLKVEAHKEERQVYYLMYTPQATHAYPILIVEPFVARKKANGDLYKTDLTFVEDAYPNELPAVSRQEQALMDQCRGLSLDYFETSIQRLMRAVQPEERLTVVLRENWREMKSIWDRLIEEEKEVYWTYSISVRGSRKPDDLIPLRLMQDTPTLVWTLSVKGSLTQLTPRLRVAGVVFALEEVKVLHPLCVQVGDCCYMNDLNTVLALQMLDQRPDYQALNDAFPAFFDQIIGPLSQAFPVRVELLPKGFVYLQESMTITSKRLFLKELEPFILIRPLVSYGDQVFNVMERDEQLFRKDQQIVRVERDQQAEQELLDAVRALHPKFAEVSHQSFFSLHHREFIDDYWFLKAFEQMQAIGVEVFGFNEFKNFKYSPHTPQIRVQASSGIDWFDVEIAVTVGDMQISLKEVKKALLSPDKYIRLGDGKLAILPSEWVKKLERYFRLGKLEKDGLKVSKLRFNALDELLEDQEQALEVRKEIQEKRERLGAFQSIKAVGLPEINATLRDYQVEGYRWMHFLNEFGWGGILADDMGLGKTLQMLTFLKSVIENGITCNLVVVPTSLLFNWQNEIQKFCPQLSYHIYHGADRERISEEWNYDVIITTYGLLASDIDYFRKVKFGYVVLDESQAIKNPASKRFKAVTLLKAKNRMVMTGTPIENSTMDLYAQMAFVNPGLFQSIDHFREEYANRIDKQSDQERARELNRLIHPFVLRRTKEMVAKELPPKTEDVIYCEMEPEQRKVYDAFRNKYRNEILGLMQDEGLDNIKLHVLQALTKLRQVCNSVALVNEEEAYYGNESVKIKELLRHIQEKTGHHKMLIFSQFVGMLGLIRNELDSLDINYVYLDGQTAQNRRKEVVGQFQDDGQVRVFLISLKAGGVGLNLTAADYVYIVDPWWNPAVENQAIDRCYRIGQDKSVIAYRMICKDTLEEKIMNLKSRKQHLADSLIQTDENLMKQITREDIMELLA